MKDLLNIYDECVQKLDDIGIKTGVIKEVKVNNRFTKVFGRCRKINSVYGEMFVIEINPILLDDSVSEIETENTMIHELLHTCKNCFNHGNEWKHLAMIVNKKYGYNISRTVSNLEISDEVIEIIEKKAKHKLICEKCNNEFYKNRMCKVVKYPQLFRCGKCGGNLKVLY